MWRSRRERLFSNARKVATTPHAGFGGATGNNFSKLFCHWKRSAAAQMCFAVGLGRYPWWRTFAGFPRSDRSRASEILNDLGLAAHIYRRAAEVSGGEQQRAALGRGLFQERTGDVCSADEPVSNLNPELTCGVMKILRQQAREYARTVVCVLHDRDLVESFADIASP